MTDFMTELTELTEAPVRPAVPIERHSLLSNRRALALVTPDADVTWLCQPSPDSPALFAKLLGGDGHFSIRPRKDQLPLGQRYVPGTMSVQTRWTGLQVTDRLADGLVRVVEGRVPAVVEFAPRPDFGRAPVRLEQTDEGLRLAGTKIELRSPGVDWQITNGTATAVLTSPATLELRWDEPSEKDVDWPGWAQSLRLPETRRDMVRRSALTLRALCHRDTGAVLAAATTSLPEQIGGIRNWDYRYCWLRDAALTVQALVSLGSADEAEAFLDWLHRVLATVPGPEHLNPLYTIHGTTLGPEVVIDTLPGYAGSGPVRVGNLADQQVQLDVFGPITDLVHDLAVARGVLADRDWQVVTAMVRAVTRRWNEPDHGIWEERHVLRHRVYSRVMCWQTLDRAITLATRFGRELDPGWPVLRDKIAAEVLGHGWNPGVGAFTTAYDGTDLDAASLHVGLSGLLDPADERFHATVVAIEEVLRSGPTVYRYLRNDGLPGDEGGFHLCTAWLIEAYLLVGRRADAEELFESFAGLAGPTGLLPEEYDPVNERSLGNHPQAYSHLGLIRCARLLDES
ncbi:glycoside hydrolase family 15 protein [Lentzea sp. NPDC051213]|uniref:glycoside hydrolase family 15 protein n=1 Tax=Lentzea sp. NPDC051213 TaxID=3364126 RepID=UPI0037A0B936